MKMTRQRIRFVARGTAAVVVVLAGAAWAQEAAPPAAVAPPPNVVQHEMRLLEEAMLASVRAIANGDVRELPKMLHGVHTAAGDTGAALESGGYRPPKNAEQVAAFRALDKAFHDDMIAMVKAARGNDVEATAQRFGALMARCHGCHTQFRR